MAPKISKFYQRTTKKHFNQQIGVHRSISCSRSSDGGGRSRSGGGRGTLRPAADATWRPEIITAVLGSNSYALLFLLLHFQGRGVPLAHAYGCP